MEWSGVEWSEEVSSFTSHVSLIEAATDLQDGASQPVDVLHGHIAWTKG